VRQAEELCACAGCRATLDSLRESLAGLPLACGPMSLEGQGEGQGFHGQTDGLPLCKPGSRETTTIDPLHSRRPH
jgi:hypothetical protein